MRPGKRAWPTNSWRRLRGRAVPPFGPRSTDFINREPNVTNGAGNLPRDIFETLSNSIASFTTFWRRWVPEGHAESNAPSSIIATTRQLTCRKKMSGPTRSCFSMACFFIVVSWFRFGTRPYISMSRSRSPSAGPLGGTGGQPTWRRLKTGAMSRGNAFICANVIRRPSRPSSLTTAI